MHSLAKPQLTPKQARVLAYLIYYRATHQRMPSTREIQTHLGLASQTSAVNYLRHLEAKGRIKRHKYEHRAITIL